MKRLLCILLTLMMLASLLPAPALAAESPAPAAPVAPVPGLASPTWQVELPPITSVPVPASAEVLYNSIPEAVSAIREGMKQRRSTVTVTLRSNQEWASPLQGLVEMAYAHTGVPTEGDYLRANTRISAWNTFSREEGGVFYQTLTYSFHYFSTAQQEQEVDRAVSRLLAELNLWALDDYSKVKAIYDWMCANITYDYANLNDESYDLKFSAYAAMIHRTAVCNGYAALLYRLLLEVGVDNRFLSGDTSQGYHAWNIVRLGNRYYYCDSTWDAGRGNYLYFLKSPENFPDHTDESMYTTAGFRAAYPLGTENYIYGGADTANTLTWSLEDGTLTVSGTGPIPVFTPDTQPWKDYRPYIRRVVLEKGVTAIGDNAFYGCENLTSVSLPNTLTWVGGSAFFGCKSLKSVSLPSGVAGIGDLAFGGCTSLSTVTLTTGLRDIGRFAFDGCGSLRSLTLPTTLTALGDYAFRDCASLTRADIPAGVIKIPEGLFCGCKGIKEIPIPDSVQEIGNYAFYDCASLKSAVIPEGVTAVNDLLFCGCSGLTRVGIPKTVTTIAQFAFYNCASLTGISLPEGLEELGNCVFYGCGALKSVTIPKGVTAIPNLAFALCGSLTDVSILGPVSRVENHIFWGCTALKNVTFTGNAPAFSPESFLYAAATVSYPGGDPTWAGVTGSSYGGTITWKPYKVTCAHGDTKLVNAREAACTVSGYTGDTVCILCGETLKTGSLIPAAGHQEVSEGGYAATCTEEGYRAVRYCAVCGETLGEGEIIPALGHSWDEGVLTKDPTYIAPGEAIYTCTRCGETETVEVRVSRIAGSNRFETAFAVADTMKRNLGIEQFDAVIIASGTNFPDALSGSYLAAVKKAPILLSFNADYNERTMDYIRENLKPNGTVYLLGSEDVVPESFRFGLTGYWIKRLGGANRFDTNLEILKEAGVEGKDVLVCTGTGFADSLSASAAGLPILLVWNDLFENQEAFLEEYCTGSRFWIVGSETAVSNKLLSRVAEYGMVQRIGGANRFETSVKLAETFFDGPEYAVLAYAWNYPDGLCGGPLALTMNAPLILTMTGYETAAEAYIRGEGISRGTVLGGKSLISDDSVRYLFR